MTVLTDGNDSHYSEFGLDGRWPAVFEQPRDENQHPRVRLANVRGFESSSQDPKCTSNSFSVNAFPHAAPPQAQTGSTLAWELLCIRAMSRGTRLESKVDRGASCHRWRIYCSLEKTKTEESMPRYAWLEFNEGKWHFLTNLYSQPAESTRWWSDRQIAVRELLEEGWKIVREYPRMHRDGEEGEAVTGYGLTRIWQYN